jgi:hypothetical protein
MHDSLLELLNIIPSSQGDFSVVLEAPPAVAAEDEPPTASQRMRVTWADSVLAATFDSSQSASAARLNFQVMPVNAPVDEDEEDVVESVRKRIRLMSVELVDLSNVPDYNPDDVIDISDDSDEDEDEDEDEDDYEDEHESDYDDMFEGVEDDPDTEPPLLSRTAIASVIHFSNSISSSPGSLISTE